MAEIGSAFLTIAPSARGFGRTLESDVSRETDGVGKKLGTGFGKVFAASAGLLAAAGIGSFLKDSIGEAREAQKVGAATEAILKATGGAAKLSAAQIGDLASSLSAKIGVDDEAIQSGENLLLTFKNVKTEGSGLNDIFKRATVAGADLAAAGFGSISGNALQLGKALNDPIKGISALSRSGVTFTEVQKEQIKGFVASNDLLSAQKVILGEVEKQVGGTAAATATSGEKAAVAFGNLKEAIGTALLPVVDKLANAFLKAMPSIESAIGKTVAFISTSVVPIFQSAFGTIQVIFERLRPAIDGAFGFIKDNPDLLKAFAIGLGVVAVAVGAVTLATTLFSIALNSTGIPLIIIGLAALVAGLIYAYQHSEAFRNVVNAVGAALAEFGGFLKNQVLPFIVDLAQRVGSNLGPIFKALGDVFRNNVLPAVQLLIAKFREYQPAIQKVVEAIQKVIEVVVKVVAQFLDFYTTIVGKVLPPVIRFAGFLLSNLVPAIVDTIDVAARIIKTMVEVGTAFVDGVKDVARFVSGLKDKISDAIANVKLLPARVINALSGVGSALLQSGKDLIQGFINGIISKATDAVQAVKNAASSVIGAAKNAFGIFSPSRVFKEIGVYTMLGLEKGIHEGGPKAVQAVKDAMEKVLDNLKSKRDDIKSVLDGLKSDFASLSSSVASAFTGNLFEAGNAQDFLTSLATTRGNLTNLKAAFKKLIGFGLDPAFLAQLFQSGNLPLILDLAKEPRDQALGAASLFGETQALANSLGNKVAQADIGPKIDRTNSELAEIKKAIRQQAAEFARELNRVSAAGVRRAA